MAMPSSNLGDLLATNGAETILLLPQVAEPPSPFESGFHLHVEGSEVRASVVSVVICFPSSISYSNALALKDQREVCSLSREMILQSLAG
jgi:hypothetical protein